MLKITYIFTLISCAVLTTVSIAIAQRDSFIKIEGPTLRARIDTAVRQARSAGQPFFWTAYSFDVRPGVAVDVELTDFRGSTNTISDTSISIGTSHGVKIETRNLGIFLLHDGNANRITRLEVYNLERQREYSRYPVYWLGRGSNEESLTLLKGLVSPEHQFKVGEHAVMSIGLHDDPQVSAILKDFIRSSAREQVRSSSVFWLGQIGGEQAFLADLVRGDRESVEFRKKAAFAIGVSKDATALSTLKGLYGEVAHREIKRQIIFAASINENKDQAIDFLINIAGNDPDTECKKQALFWLGQRAGDRSLKVLGDVANSADADTEVQKQAVFAISRRPKDEAIPLLIKIARTHPKAEVRKQALFWLGRSGDERALELFKEILTK
jgi:hypothetical protein